MYIKKFNENLDNNVLICVDIQKEYEDAFQFRIDHFLNFINKYDNIIYYVYDGEEIGGPTESELIDWLLENGLEESKLHNIRFFDKEHGFLRTYMDSYNDVEGLYELLRYMMDNKYTHSTDIPIDEYSIFNNSDIKDFLENGDCIILDFKVFKMVKQFPKNFNLCGGGQFECLREMEIVFELFNKSYHKINRYIY
jgi:hypothetical protein